MLEYAESNFLNHSHTLQPLKALNGTPEVTSRLINYRLTFLTLNGKVHCMLRGEQTYAWVFAQSVPSVSVEVANI